MLNSSLTFTLTELMIILLHIVNLLATVAVGMSILHRAYHIAATIFSGVVFMYLMQILIK